LTDSIKPGVWPVMLTPFAEDGSVDMDALDALTEWYIKCGVSGLFSVCLSSEMYDLTDDERLGIAKRVSERTDRRVPVFASGTFGGTPEKQSDFIRRIADTGVDGVVVIASQMTGKDEDESVWQSNVERVLDHTNDVRLGLYECPRPYHRILSADALSWCAQSGRFDFIKDTSCHQDSIRSKIEVTRNTSLRFYDACAATLLVTLNAGGDGFCGIAANFYADLYVWLCLNFDTDSEMAGELHRFLSVAERAIGVGYPSAAKLFLNRAGLPVRPACRASSVEFTERDLRILADLEGLVHDWRLRIKSPLK